MPCDNAQVVKISCFGAGPWSHSLSNDQRLTIIAFRLIEPVLRSTDVSQIIEKVVCKQGVGGEGLLQGERLPKQTLRLLEMGACQSKMPLPVYGFTLTSCIACALRLHR